MIGMKIKPTGLNSGAAISMLNEGAPRLPTTIAGKLELLHYLLHFPITDENGYQIYYKNGKPKTIALVTKKQAKKLLGIE
jgi:hypothetical protein